jgi:hypothetical protein
MAPYRTKAQKQQFIAMSALRRQEGGPGHVVADEPVPVEVQRAQAAQVAAESALEDAQALLQEEHEHSKKLYQTLRNERRKTSRVRSANELAEANLLETQHHLKQLEDDFAQLTLKNQQLELTISELLENWAREKKISNDTLQGLRRKVKALQEKCRRAPDVFRKAIERTKDKEQKFALMEGGVYTDEARELCRVLVNAGCSQDLVGDIIDEVLAVAGISVIGPKMSSRTVRRAILEGGVMADIQVGHEIAKASSLTVSSDGTTHRNINYESRHVNVLAPIYESDEAAAVVHQSRLVGVDSAPDHSSQTQLDGWKSKIKEKLDIYNQSPLAQRSQTALRLADFFARLQGMNGDHAKDQKKLATLLKEIKAAFLQESLGGEKLVGMSFPEIQVLLTNANNQKIANVGGPLKWNALSDEEKLRQDVQMMSAVVLKLGHEAYANLSDDEKHKADFFIWVGCAMHKDLNCVKGGNEEMSAWWDENDVQGPVLLANKDNAAVLEQAEDAEDYTAAEQRAYSASSGGGVKLASLAGMIFNNKNDKVGQQDMHQLFFLARGIKETKFPDTNNTRYQSHCGAAAVLLTHLKLYIELMEWIRDGKEKPGFTNVEKNVYIGLQDPATQTELAVLALYAQAISHPYMRQVRGPGTEQVNMLDLGPLHFRVQDHIEKIIQDPYLLLPPHGSYESGAMDGKPWENPEVMGAIFILSSSLPYLVPVLVAFFKGALVTWKRFTTEFQEGGEIDKATTEEKAQAWMPPTNDVNEGALGALRSYLRRKPNTTMHQYNALAMFKFNHTTAFVKHLFVNEDHVFVRQEARKRDGGNLERKWKNAVAESKDKQVAEKRDKAFQKAQRMTQEKARLAGIECLEDVEQVTVDMTITQLKDQLEIYRKLVDGIPLKSHLRTKAAMLDALKAAIRKYKAGLASES